MKNIAIIPARSGSKGLPDKNIKSLCGKPMLAYTIEAALKSNMFDEVMVSTDSEKYAEIAREYGANVPFLRSEKNSSDKASSWDMVEEVLKGYEDMGERFDTFCLLQPTSPMRTEKNIAEAYRLYDEKQATAVVSVCEVEHSPRWSNTLDNSLSLNGFVKPNDAGQRQQQDTYYRLNGAVYIVDIKHFGQTHFFYDEGAYAYVMDRRESVDVDCELDFLYAETVMKNYN